MTDDLGYLLQCLSDNECGFQLLHRLPRWFHQAMKQPITELCVRVPALPIHHGPRGKRQLQLPPYARHETQTLNVLHVQLSSQFDRSQNSDKHASLVLVTQLHGPPHSVRTSSGSTHLKPYQLAASDPGERERCQRGEHTTRRDWGVTSAKGDA